jgi:chromate reductase
MGMNDMKATVHVLGIAGSLRKGSLNAAALRAAQELVPEGMVLEIFDIRNIPSYDGDIEEQAYPPEATALKERIAAADALLFVTPEYNYSVSGVLKNAIDWASRPNGNTPLPGKPTAIMGASPGIFGTVRAQAHLRDICACFNLQVLNKPEVYISQAHEKFDEQGRLMDEETKKRIRALLEALQKWTLKLQQS